MTSDEPADPPPAPEAPDAPERPRDNSWLAWSYDQAKAETDGPYRLHYAAAVSHGLRSLRDAAVPLLIAIFAGGGGSGGMFSLGIAVVGVMVSFALGIARWQTTTYTITPGALHYRSGLISPDDVVVPIERIQAVDTIAGPIQRLFGVTGLHVQTPGGGDDGDVVLSALSAADAAHLRAALGHRDATATSEDRHPYRRLSTRALLLTALTAPQLTVVLPVVGALFGLLQDGNLAGSGEAEVKNINSVGEAATVIIILLVGAWLLSFLGAIVAFAGFEVERSDGRLRLRRGLLQRRAVSVPVGRIDGVQIVESPLRRPFGLVTLRLEVTSLGGRETAARTLYPLLPRRDVPELLSTLLPEMSGSLAIADRPPSRARRRYVTWPLAFALAASALLIILVPAAWPAAPVLVLLAIVSGLDAYNIAGLRLSEDEPRIIVRARRRGSRVTLIARRRRLQELELTRSPFQRRAGLASIHLEVARGTRLGVRHLDRPLAARVLEDAPA
jgi:putative membrane protein